MIRWALRSVLENVAGFSASIAGVSVAFVLVLFLEAIFAGEALQIVAYPTHADADVWVMQKGVANMHMATSLVGRGTVDKVRAVEGVADVTPILYQSSFLRVGSREWFTYVVGIEPGASRGHPWTMTAGRSLPAPGEVVISDILARQAEIVLGDFVHVADRDLEVVGLSAGTWSMANTVTWVGYADLADMLSAPRAVSYMLVKAQPGVTAEALAARLRDRVAGINAMPRATFVDNDRRMAMQMGGDVIGLMTTIGSIVGALIVASAVYATTSRRARELAVIKALGATSRSMYGAVLLQTCVLTITGYALAITLALVVGPLLHRVVPAVTLSFSPASIARLGGIAFVVAATAGLIPARRVALSDPSSVFSS